MGGRAVAPRYSYRRAIQFTWPCLVVMLILTLSGVASPSAAQDTGTPAPTITPTLPKIDLSRLPVITAANADKLTEIASLSPGHVSGATWSPDGKTLAVYGDLGIWLYSLDNLDNPRYLQSDLNVGHVVFSQDSKLLADQSYFEKYVTDFWETTETLTSFTAVQLWDISSGERTELLPNVVSPFFSADSSTLIVQDADRGAPRLLFWDIPTGKYRLSLPNVYQAVGSPLGDIVACAETNQDFTTTTVIIRSTKSGQVIRMLNRRSSSVDTMMIDPTGQYLLVSGTAPIQIWDIKTGKLRSRLGTSVIPEDPDPRSMGKDIVDVFFSQDGTMLALVVIPFGQNGLVGIMDVASGEQLEFFPTDYWSAIYFARDTVLVVNDSRSSSTNLRGTTRLKEFRQLSYPQFNPANSLIAFLRAYPDNGISLYGIP